MRALSCLPLAAAFSLLLPAGNAPAQDEDLPWSFRPVARPAIDPTAYANWARDDLDRLIAARLEAAGLRPNGDADRPTLIRRAAFDLTGLPPTTAELDRFLADPAPTHEAFARVVDSYLASPRFGERWARHWLDVARYADSVGRTWNAPFPYAWKYRDWVIAAFNEDKPYHRFVAEQIAGDLLPAATVEQRREQVIGTGFLTLGSLTLNNGGGDGYLLDQIDDQIDVTTRGFLALSIACARCHDHSYDPVTQIDYYALAGIFHSSWTYPGQAHVSDHTAAGYLDPEMLVSLPTDLDSPLKRVSSIPSGVHTMGDLRQFGGKAPPPYDLVADWAMGMREGKPADCELRVKGIAYDLGDAPPRGDIRIPGLPDFPPVPADASGRLQLAQWIASPTHPLTARVMVNRIWQHLFGRGLVETVDNFGTTGREPSHPELLDHLAIRFVEGDWSVKRLIRTILLSRTYSLDGSAQPAGMEKDPDNTLYWRTTPRRLELEPIRDTLLAVSGDLEPEPPAPGHLAGMSGRGNGRLRSELGFDSPYRTIYLPILRDLLPDEYATFDFPDPSGVNGLRHVTTAPPQALFFLNSRFVADAARRTAIRLLEGEKSDADRIRAAYRLILSRDPAAAEVADAESLMTTLDAAGSDDPEIHRWSVFIQSLFAGAEFRYVL
ncbi:MAG: DUF1553 domain-containing protein [Verrucomicrobiales bacterium]|nr:DUF1553 domain-containing protein [Verrucomicrobiales bacterium]